MILDTSYLLDLKRGDSGAFDRGVELHDEGVPQRIPAHVFFELFYGVGRTQSEEERRRVQNALMGYIPVEATPRISRVAGEMLGRIDIEDEATGDVTGIEVGDAYVGATARVLDEPVLTRNAADFERMPGVRVESY